MRLIKSQGQESFHATTAQQESGKPLRICEKIRKRRSRPQGCVSFWLGLRLLGRDSRPKGDSLPKAARRAMQSIGNTAAGIAAALTPWPAENPVVKCGTL